MECTQAPFGATRDGLPVTAYCLRNGSGASVTLLDYGATVQSLCVLNRRGGTTDVALGYDTLAEYEAQDAYLGATVGRVANRIGGACFSLNGTHYPLARNDGENHLHGGLLGFDKRLWHAALQGDALVFSRLSPDGEEGYPGNLQVTVAFSLTEDNALRIRYDAETDRDTLINLTNHTYFNLNGGGTVLDHTLQVFAQRITENDSASLPTGRALDVTGTPFDFRQPKTIGADIGEADEQLRRGGGYDHNFVLAGRQAAVLFSAQSGVELTVETDLPGMQVYTANFLSQRQGKAGRRMGPRDGVCLETQLFPNAMRCYGFPSPVLHPGEHLHLETIYRFRRV